MASAKAVSFELDDRKIRTLHPAFLQDTVCPKAVESLSASSLNWSLQPAATEPNLLSGSPLALRPFK
jgi:hypothetical protein